MTVDPSQRRSAPRLLIAAVMTVLLLALAPAATGRPAGAHQAACQSTTRTTHHGSRQSRCARHHKSVKHPGKHHKSPAHKTTPHKPPARVAARCEDGSLPVRSAPAAFSCDDESEPGCPDGSEATLATGGTALTCPAAASGSGSGETGNECPAEGECVPWEPPCEVAEEEEELPGCTIPETES